MEEATLLVELVTEELPPKALKALGQAFAERIAHGLAGARLVAADTNFSVFATPRRLGVALPGVRARGADHVETRKLMPATVAYGADGTPTPALVKRLEKEGAPATATQVRDGHVWLEQRRAGATLVEGLQGALDDAIAKLPIPKRMSYQRYDAAGHETTVQFVRPAHALVALHGDERVPVTALGLMAGRATAGHRFLGPSRLDVADAASYEAQLEREGKVVARFDARRALVERALHAAAGAHRAVMPDALLDEVTALVEWPVVVEGTFDTAFLDVPQECLVLTMQQNQKYFALTDADGTLVNRFLVVSNMQAADPSRIAEGNERVLRARLADAKFFYDQDRKRPLADRVDGLKAVVYHHQLGSQHDRMQRVETLAGSIATALGYDADDARRAARLAKADLLTDMVGEFPELQGSMGRYYARHDGEKAEVADAIEEQYRPRFAGDALPRSNAGTALALADKLETLAGLFSIGALPTGDKDPFALRRHALGIVRLLIEKSLSLDLDAMVGEALRPFALTDAEHGRVVREIIVYVRARAAGYGRELGYTTNEVESALSEDIHTLAKRWSAVSEVSSRPEFLALAAANKRVGNILRKSERGDGDALSIDLFTEPAEKDLWHALTRIGPRLDQAIVAGDYLQALLPVAELREPVDAFFDQVMVNVDDPKVRNNRLALLSRLEASMNRVADISKLAA